MRIPLSSALVMSYTVSAAIAAAVIASISTPVPATVAAVARIATPPATTSALTSTKLSGSGWHIGMSSLVFFAAWIPANRATSNGLPFGFFGSAASTASFNSTNALATASRRVSAFALTSTMCAWPASSKCESLSLISLSLISQMLSQQHPHTLASDKSLNPVRQHHKPVRPRVRREISRSLPRHHTHAHLSPVALNDRRKKPRNPRSALHVLCQLRLDKRRRNLSLSTKRTQHRRDEQSEANLR